MTGLVWLDVVGLAALAVALTVAARDGWRARQDTAQTGRREGR